MFSTVTSVNTGSTLAWRCSTLELCPSKSAASKSVGQRSLRAAQRAKMTEVSPTGARRGAGAVQEGGSCQGQQLSLTLTLTLTVSLSLFTLTLLLSLALSLSLSLSL